MKRIFAAFVLFFSLPALWPRTVERGCGSEPGKRDEIRLLHRQSQSRRSLAADTRPLRSARAAGDIVVMDADSGLLETPNDFDLDGRQLRFEPAGPAHYRLTVSETTPRRPAVTARRLTLGDDDTALVEIPFDFPFAGQTWRDVWVNSDGNLTFGRPDTATSPRALGRFLAGPPRIAPLFMDLDPSRAGAVLVEASADQMILTWLDVPEYRSIGIGPPNTFSIALSPQGAIQLSLEDTGTFATVVGIARGGADPGAQLFDFSATPGGGQTVAATAAERFSQTRSIDIVSVSQRFFAQFDDAYDYLVLYNNMGIQPESGAVAFESTVRNDRTGYGDRELDDGDLYGSRRRLQAFLNLGPLSQYPVDPNGIVPARGPVGDTPLSILAHEAGHLFLAFASPRDPDNPAARPVLGFQSAHWGFNFNSEASLLEGNRIRDLGADQSPRFITERPVQAYSPLDQYLMGLRAPEEVPPTFLVANPSVGTFARLPQEGLRFNGTRRDVTVDDFIAAEGRRAPDHTLAQRRYRFAFILVVAPGTEPTAEQLAQIDRYRTEFEPYFARVTSGRAEADTRLRSGVRFSVQPTAGIVAGEAAQIRLELARPATTDQRFRLTTSDSFLQIPAEVTIPRGASFAAVRLDGRAPGVALVRAEPAGEGFETAITRVQVAPSRRDLRVWIRFGDRQSAIAGRPLEPLHVRVTDINRVPYPGIALRVRAQGVVLPDAPLVADHEGELRLPWRAADADQRELELSVEGSEAPPARAVVLGRPVVADGGVVNAASGGPGLSPAAMATVYGLNLANSPPSTARLPGSIPLGGTQVDVGGRPARLTFVSDRQINFLIPDTLDPGVHPIVVRTATGASEAKPISVEATWPGIFSARLLTADRLEILATGLDFNHPVRAETPVGALPVPFVTQPVLGVWAVIVDLPAAGARPSSVRLASRDRASNPVAIPAI